METERCFRSVNANDFMENYVLLLFDTSVSVNLVTKAGLSLTLPCSLWNLTSKETRPLPACPKVYFKFNLGNLNGQDITG